MRTALQLTKKGRLLLLEDFKGGERVYINTDNSDSLFWLTRVKKDGGIYVGKNKEFEKYYTNIKIK